MPTNSELLRFDELSKALRDEGIIDRDPRTLRRWATSGVKAGKKTVKLKRKMIGGWYHSTISWFHEFVAEQNT